MKLRCIVDRPVPHGLELGRKRLGHPTVFVYGYLM